MSRRPGGSVACTAVAIVVVVLASVLPAAGAEARPPSTKKSMWGPVDVRGRSAFPIYRELGVRWWQASFSWSDVAPVRPRDPRNPDDPAYRWPERLDRAMGEAKRARIAPALMVMFAPRWANGGRTRRWAPLDAGDYADFMVAAARRYPSVRHWMVWGEPARNMLPMPPHSSVGPRTYARILDRTYVALKRLNRRNQVIGGMTFSSGAVPPAEWPRRLRLPNGRRPRMDMWGHNPYEYRRPKLSKPLPSQGLRGLSDIDNFIREIDRDYGYRRGKLKLWLSEYCVQSEHPSRYFAFSVSRREQALYVRDAFKIVNRMPRVAALGWYQLEDEPHDGGEHNGGLITYDGVRKPAYFAFKRAR